MKGDVWMAFSEEFVKDESDRGRKFSDKVGERMVRGKRFENGLLLNGDT